MTSFYESKTNGLNFDRFADDLPSSSLNSAESTIAKMRQHFWTAKQVLRQKVLRKKEDGFLLASDADFDTKLSRYFSIRNTTREMLAAIEDYHHFVSQLVEEEKSIGDFLQMESNGEKDHLGQVMRVSANSLRAVSKHRQKTIRPLIRLYHDLDVFNERAVADCASTVEAAERLRMEYRGSLLWFKNASEELDPNSSAAMDKFRTAQTVVRQNKEKFDKLKEDTHQKVDLLTQSRSQLLVELAREYAISLLQFYENTSKVYEAVAQNEQMIAIDTYEIDILKILNDPVGLAMEKQKEQRRMVEQQREQRKKTREKRRKERQAGQVSCEDESDIVELDEIGLGQVVNDVPTQELPLWPGSEDKREENSIRGRRLADHLQQANYEDMYSIPLNQPPTHRSPSKHPGAKCHPKSSSEGLFRVESPLGILDDSKFEEEEEEEEEEVEGDQKKQEQDMSLMLGLKDKQMKELPPLKLQPSGGLHTKSNIFEDLMSVDLDTPAPFLTTTEPFWNPFNSTPTSSLKHVPELTDWSSLLQDEIDQTKEQLPTSNSLLL